MDGGGDGATWTDADNWDTNAVPLETDDVVFPDTTIIVFTPSPTLITVLDISISYGSEITFNFPLYNTRFFSIESNPQGGVVPGPTTLTFNEQVEFGTGSSGWVMSGAASVLTINFNANTLMRMGSNMPSFSQHVTFNIADDVTVVNNNNIGLGEFFGTPTLQLEGMGNYAINGSFEVFPDGIFINNLLGQYVL